MATKQQVIENFAKQTGKFAKGSLCGNGKYNLFYENQVLYSYGHHFPLAIRASKESEIPDGAEGFGCGIQYIINGDKVSVSTSSHQNECIRTLKENVQIPFSALEQAWMWAANWGNVVTRLKNMDDGFRIVAWKKDEWQHSHDEGKTWSSNYFHGWVETGEPSDMGVFACDTAGCEFVGVVGTPDPGNRHRLGAALFIINNKYFLSSFDELDRGNYFLCHVPGEPGSVEEAYVNLMPKVVKLHAAYSGEYLRQGDWFFLPQVMDDEHKAWVKEKAKGELKSVRLGGPQGTHVASRLRGAYGDQAGLTMVSGTVRHAPLDGRRPEHKRLKLGDGKSWWIPVKNTSEASWGAVGNVD